MESQPTAPRVRVPLIDESEASGRTADLYEQIMSATNLPFVPDMFRLTSTKPELLNAVIAGFTGIFGSGVLARETKELVAAWTSKLNECPYCVGTHNWFLQQFGGSRELAESITVATSIDELPIDEKTRELMRLITRVSTEAYRITDADWDRTITAGWSNEELLEAVYCAALFNFINRLVDALGLGTSVQQSRISRQPQTKTG